MLSGLNIFSFYKINKKFYFLWRNLIYSYIISIGMIDKLSLFMSNIRGPIDQTPELAYFFQNIISLLTSITSLMTLRCDNIFGAKIVDDETQFMMTLRMTHICGVVSLIYGMLLHSGAPVRGDNVPPIAPKHTLDLTLEAIQFINHVSLLDLTMIQVLIYLIFISTDKIFI
jgi:hypothetical protein